METIRSIGWSEPHGLTCDDTRLVCYISAEYTALPNQYIPNGCDAHLAPHQNLWVVGRLFPSTPVAFSELVIDRKPDLPPMTPMLSCPIEFPM